MRLNLIYPEPGSRIRRLAEIYYRSGLRMEMTLASRLGHPSPLIAQILCANSAAYPKATGDQPAIRAGIATQAMPCHEQSKTGTLAYRLQKSSARLLRRRAPFHEAIDIARALNPSNLLLLA